ncbi:hypothetical protein A5N15_09340 [Rothia kristinae]|uniref:Uncharacterized protein n=1 Tax=Rothia kristinae TaxID=37923 RepID=A0A657IV90_9MICC|nr:hypothetical protein A5N15_09340 [Rothia kristinae]
MPPATRTRPPPRRIPCPRGSRAGLHRPWLLAVPAAMLVFLVVSLVLSGSAAGTALKDPGAFVRWALPVAEAVLNLSMAATMGALLFAVAFIPRFARDARGPAGGRTRTRPAAQEEDATEYGPFAAVLNFAAVSALTWTIAGLTVLVLAYADISGTRISADAAFTSQLLGYIQGIGTGQEQAAVVIVGAVTTTLVFAVRQLLGLFLTLAFSFIAIVAMA